MKAIVHHEYGAPEEVLQLREVEKPLVGDDEVLVRVRAAALNPADWLLTNGVPYVLRAGSGLLRPKDAVRGTDVAGQVEAVGKSVKELRPGDEVFGWCKGSLAEYVSGAEARFVPKPAGLTFEQAAAIPMAAQVALQGLRDKGRIRSGQQVLINGASGGVGTFAVQLAKAFGAEVTAVCSARNVDQARALGADRVIDYTKEDLTRSGERYDLILDVAGNRPLSELRRVLASRGILVMAGGSHRLREYLPRLLGALAVSAFASQKVVPLLALHSQADLLALKELVEAGKVTPVIDRTYALSEAAEAIRYVGAGHARGKVVITA